MIDWKRTAPAQESNVRGRARSLISTAEIHDNVAAQNLACEGFNGLVLL